MPSVIITGGTKGIGRCLVLKFASKGFDIATCARNQSELDSLKKIVESNYPTIKIFLLKCDISKKDEIINFGKLAIIELGTVDVLINNAGIFIQGSISKEEEDVFEKQINTNLASAYHLTRTILPGLLCTQSSTQAGIRKANS